MKARLPVTLFLLLGGILLALPGCGGGSGGGGSAPAGIAPPSAPIFVEATIRPKGELQANVEEVARIVAGIDDLGELILSELESSAREDGEPFDYETEVEPWLGERAGIFLDGFDGDDFQRFGVAIQTTDPEATQQFVDKQMEADKDPIDDASYEGVDYKIDSADESVIGIVGELLVVTEKERAFKDAVDAANGDSLDDEAAYGDAIEAAAEGSLADVYVDVGLLIEQSGEAIDEQALQILRGAGIDPREATAVASVVPGPDRVEVEISSDLGDQGAPSGDPSELLGSLPADSFAAFAVSGFGAQLQEAVDSLDKEGIPGQIPPGKLKSGLKEAGIDLEEIVGSLDDAGLFVEGSSESNLGGAAVFTAEDPNRARNTVSNIGTLLRGAGAPGVSELSGEANGFAVRDPELGDEPLVVAAQGERIAIGYGEVPTLRALEPVGQPLSGDPDYKAAVASLGGTPISAFVDGAGAMRLAESLVPRSETGFWEAQPYLSKIRFLALGSTSEGELATAKLIVGLTE